MKAKPPVDLAFLEERPKGKQGARFQQANSQLKPIQMLGRSLTELPKSNDGK
jgi:hypothetical protein